MSIDGEGTQVSFIFHFKGSKRYILILWEKKKLNNKAYLYNIERWTLN